MALVSSFAKEPLVSSFTKQPLKSSFIEEPEEESSILGEIGKATIRAPRSIAKAAASLLGRGDEGDPSLLGFIEEADPMFEATPQTLPQQLAGSITEDVVRQGFTIALSGGKKNLALGLMGSVSASAKYRELRDEGVEPGTALPMAAANFMLEVGTEKLGLDILLDKDVTGVKSWLLHTMADIVGEEVAEFGDMGLDTAVLGKKFPGFKESMQRAAMVAMNAFGAGSVMSLGKVGANKLQKKHTEKVNSAIEAELALAIDKAVPKPVATLKEKAFPQTIKDTLTTKPGIKTFEVDNTGLPTQEELRFQELSAKLAEQRDLAGVPSTEQVFGEHQKKLDAQETRLDKVNSRLNSLKDTGENAAERHHLLREKRFLSKEIPSQKKIVDSVKKEVLKPASKAEKVGTINTLHPEMKTILESRGSLQESDIAPDVYDLDAIGDRQSITIDGYRGEGRVDKTSIFAEGITESVFGDDATYLAINKDAAAEFGPNVIKRTITLKNPKIITSDSELSQLLGGGPVPTNNEQRIPLLKAARKKLDAEGFDGVVINVPVHADTDSRGRSVKRLREIFGITQTVVFPKKKVATKKVPARPEVQIDRLSLDEPSTVPLETNQKEKMDISEPTKIERAFRDVLTQPKEKAQGVKGYNELVKAGAINEQQNIDINKVEAKVSFPHTIAKKSPKFLPIYKRANDSLQNRDTRVSVFAQNIDPYFSLDKKSQTKVDTIKRMERIERNNTPFTQETLSQVLNQQELAGYAAFTDTMKMSANMLGEHLSKMGATQESVDEFMGNLSPETFFPLSRDGDFFTLVKDRTGETVHYEFHKTKKAMKARAVQLSKQKIGEVKTGPVKQTSDEIAKGLPVNMLAFLSKFDDNPTAKNPLDRGIGLELSKAYAEVLSKGFPTHLIKAKNTPGFEKDLKAPAARYLDTIATWIERREARRDMGEMLANIDPVKESNLFSTSKKYIDYVTGSTNELAGFRKFLFLYYIGGNTKSAIVNSTQSIMTGWPVMSKYTSWSLPKLSKYATMSLRPLSVIQKSDPDLAAALKHGLFDGVLDAQHVNVLRGENRKSVLGQKAEDLITIMFSEVERYNRKVMFTAMYKEATGNGVKIDGKRVKMSHPEAIAFAENTVDEAHWNMTKADRPAITRGITAPVFTFKLFMGNYFSLMKTLYTEKEFGALARMLGATLVMGGLSAFPFAKDLEKILEKMGYDPRTSIKEMSGKWGDMLLHGALFPAGPDISGSISALEFVPSDIDQGTWPAVANVMLGVPADIVNRAQRAVHLYKLGDTYRAVETLMPEAVRNPMVAIRWAREGMRTPRGKKIGDVTTRDIILKFLAINPKAATKAYEREHSLRLLSERARAASANINQRVAKAMFAGDWEELAEINIEIAEHNQRMLANGTMEESIIPDPAAQKRAISLMQNPDAATLDRLPKKARGRAIELMEIQDQPQIGE